MVINEIEYLMEHQKEILLRRINRHQNAVMICLLLEDLLTYDNLTYKTP